MAQKLRNNNQKTPTNNLNRRDLLDSELLTFEPKGKAKSKKERIRERQEREKLLQQHRMMQQKSLKQQYEREHGQHVPENVEHQHSNQRSQDNKHPEILSKPNAIEHDSMHGHANEIGEHPLTSSALRKGHDFNDQNLDALGDWNTRNVRPGHQRCSNCCGRPQYGCEERFETYKGCRVHSQFACANRVGVTSSTRCANRCSQELPTNGRLKGGASQKDAKTGRPTDAKITDNVEAEKQSNCQDLVDRNEISLSEPKEADVTDDLKTPSPLYLDDENETRLRGGCGGGCGGGGTQNSACCPCGGCGGAACGTCNTCCESKPPLGCCGGNQTRGLPCRCRCRSCSNPCPPCGTCGGLNCGKWNSCAGSGGGKCCFPRNTRRRNGPDCCGGGSGGCGGCC